mgnify:CR=1 FL=1
MIKEYLAQGLTYDEIMAKVQAEYEAYKQEQAAAEELNDLRLEAVNAIVNYMEAMLPDMDEEQLEESAQTILDGFLKVEKQVKTLKRMTGYKPVSKPKMRVVSGDEAEAILKDFFKGLK